MMRIRKKTHSHAPDGKLPLINIVLLLVLAFMMAGTVAAPLPSGFDPLRSEVREQAEVRSKPATLTVDRLGRVSIEGRDIATSNVDLLFGEISSDERELEFRVDARAPANSIIVLLGSAERAGLKDVQIVILSRE